MTTCPICDNAYKTFRLAHEHWVDTKEWCFDSVGVINEKCEALRQARNAAKEAWIDELEAHRWGAHECSSGSAAAGPAKTVR